MTSNLRILVVDDNDQVRHGLSALFKSIPDISVVGEAVNGRQSLDMVHDFRPEVVLMDVGMPIMDGIEACQKIKDAYETVKVVMLTSHDSDDDVFASLAAGANGYCLKDVDFDRLVTAIRSVAAGDLWLDSQIAAKVVGLVRSDDQQGSAVKRANQPFAPLSPREKEVLSLVVDGLGNQEIANRLSISLDTVKTHMRHIMDKLAVSDRTQMAVKAVRGGLV